MPGEGAGEGGGKQGRVQVSSTSCRREYRSTTSELRVIICRRGSQLYTAFYRDTDTRAPVITRMCLAHEGEDIPDEKREAANRVRDRGRLINWQTVNCRAQESRYKRYSILTCLFFPLRFFFRASPSSRVSPLGFATPPYHHRFLLTHNPHLDFLFRQFQLFFFART